MQSCGEALWRGYFGHRGNAADRRPARLVAAYPIVRAGHSTNPGGCAPDSHERSMFGATPPAATAAACLRRRRRPRRRRTCQRADRAPPRGCPMPRAHRRRVRAAHSLAQWPRAPPDAAATRLGRQMLPGCRAALICFGAGAPASHSSSTFPKSAFHRQYTKAIGHAINPATRRKAKNSVNGVGSIIRWIIRMTDWLGRTRFSTRQTG